MWNIAILFQHGFRIEAARVHAPEEAIVRVGEVVDLDVLRIELIDAAGDDALDEPLDAPAVSDELPGEVIQQLGMGGRGGAGSEVVHAFDEAATEEVVPEPVDRDPRGERVVAADEVLGEP